MHERFVSRDDGFLLFRQVEQRYMIAVRLILRRRISSNTYIIHCACMLARFINNAARIAQVKMLDKKERRKIYYTLQPIILNFKVKSTFINSELQLSYDNIYLFIRVK